MTKSKIEIEQDPDDEGFIKALQTTRVRPPDGMTREEQRRIVLDDPFSDLLADGAVDWFVDRGLVMDFIHVEPIVYTLGIDVPTQLPFRLRMPELEELEAIPDLEERARVMFYINLQPDCERSTALILSVAGSCWIGDTCRETWCLTSQSEKKQGRELLRVRRSYLETGAATGSRPIPAAV